MIKKYWIRLSYDLKYYADLAGCYDLHNRQIILSLRFCVLNLTAWYFSTAKIRTHENKNMVQICYL